MKPTNKEMDLLFIRSVVDELGVEKALAIVDYSIKLAEGSKAPKSVLDHLHKVRDNATKTNNESAIPQVSAAVSAVATNSRISMGMDRVTGQIKGRKNAKAPKKSKGTKNAKARKNSKAKN